MDRLTGWDNGHAYFTECFEEPCLGMGCVNEDCDFKFLTCQRLAKYEDIGLTPEQLLETDKMYLEKCEEVNQLKEQLELSREGDLISRKALLDRLNQSFQNINYHPDLGDPAEGMEQELFNEFLHDTIKLVKQQPVAYDVDKVVGEIEEKLERYYYLYHDQQNHLQTKL